MSDAYMGTIQGFGFNFPPRGWANCNGALLSISQNTALFSLLSTMYGGDGRTTFGLPDLRGRVALNMGQGPGLPNYREGVKGGTYTHTITTAQMPAHSHQMPAHNHKLRGTTAAADAFIPASNKLLAKTGFSDELYATPGTTASFYDTAPNQAISEHAAGPTSNTGGNQALNNMPPYQVIEMCIALQGLYPSRN